MKAICFDFDETLHDLDMAFEVSTERVLGPLAYTWDVELADVRGAMRRVWPSLWGEVMEGARGGHGLYEEWFRRTFHEVGVTLASSQVSALVAQYDQEFEQALSLYPAFYPRLPGLSGGCLRSAWRF